MRTYPYNVLSQAEENDPSLHVMVVKNNIVTSHQMADALRGNTTLTTLILADNVLSELDFRILFFALTTGAKSIRVLSIAQTCLTATSMPELSAYVANSQNLTSLDLSNNPAIGIVGITSLTSALTSRTSSSTIQQLNLANTSLGDEGACVVGTYLNHSHCKIQVLGVEYNHITLRGTQCFVAALQDQNLSLQKLRLWGNQMNAKQKQFLQFYLQRNLQLASRFHEGQPQEAAQSDVSTEGDQALITLPEHVKTRLTCPFSSRGLPEPMTIAEVDPQKETTSQPTATAAPPSESSQDSPPQVNRGLLPRVPVAHPAHHAHPLTALLLAGP